MLGSSKVILEVFPAKESWKIRRTDGSENPASFDSLDKALALVRQETLGSGTVCIVRVLNSNGAIDREFCTFSPSRRRWQTEH